MPSSKSYKRNYSQEQKTATARGEDSDRAKRNRARRHATVKHGKAALQGKEIDHKVPLRSGGSSSDSNTRIRGKSANRADNGHKPKRK